MKKSKLHFPACLGLAFLTFCGAAAPAASQEAADKGQLSLELNNLAATDAGCLATFMVKNGFEKPLEKVAFEIVLFGKTGRVDRMLILDFSPLTVGKTRVRQFELDGASCPDISRVLVNDTASCEAEGQPSRACLQELKTSTPLSVEFGT